MLIKDLLAKKISMLPDTLSPSDACSRLAEGEVGVVIDKNGTPHSLVTAEDIRITARPGATTLCEPGVELPRTIVVRYESDSSELSQDQLKWLNDAGSRGVVVLDDKDRVSGVVTFESALCNSMADSSGNLLMVNPAGTLAGDPSTGPARTVCLKCQFVNGIHYLDDTHPPRCQNKEWPPHTIEF